MRYQSLDMFLLDDMIEQYKRFNPLPDHNDSSLQGQMHSELLESLLTELKVLRARLPLYEMRVGQLNKQVRELMTELNKKENEG